MTDNQLAELYAKVGIAWPRTRCTMCKGAPATGVFVLAFSDGETEGRVLCAACGMYEAAHRYSGYWRRRLVRIDLALVIKDVKRSWIVKRRGYALTQMEVQS